MYEKQYLESRGIPIVFVEFTVAFDSRKGKDIPLMCRNGHSKGENSCYQRWYWVV